MKQTGGRPTVGKRTPKPIEERSERYQALAVTLTVALAYLPLASYLAWPVSAFFGMILRLRLVALRWPAAATPRPWSLLALTLVGVLNCLLVNHSLVGKVDGTALLMAMMALKLLELLDRRDYRVVAIALRLLIVVQFLFGQGIGLTLYLGLVAITPGRPQRRLGDFAGAPNRAGHRTNRTSGRAPDAGAVPAFSAPEHAAVEPGRRARPGDHWDERDHRTRVLQ